MTPRAKSNELMSKFVGISLSQVNDLVDGIRFRLAKESALIAVDELINDTHASSPFETERLKFWNDVKSELHSF